MSQIWNMNLLHQLELNVDRDVQDCHECPRIYIVVPYDLHNFVQDTLHESDILNVNLQDQLKPNVGRGDRDCHECPRI